MSGISGDNLSYSHSMLPTPLDLLLTIMLMMPHTILALSPSLRCIGRDWLCGSFG